MHEIRISPHFDSWRSIARNCLNREEAPNSIIWLSKEETQESFTELFSKSENQETIHPAQGKLYSVPKEFLDQAKFVASHRDESRWALLYRILWRITHGEPELLHISIDPDIQIFNSFYRSVRRDMHKMTAFVRFREVRDSSDPDSITYISWYEPDHLIVRLVAPFFRDRFNGMQWSILTPDDSVHWDGQNLKFAAGSFKTEAPKGDELERLWRTYYASIFNPARIKTRAMKKELPVRYWKNLPETALIHELIRGSPIRLQTFYKNQTSSAYEWLPPSESTRLEDIKKASHSCKGCSLYQNATQIVFGEGPLDAEIVFVGEQPGDQEDLAGHPFIGPAGKLLNQAFDKIGIIRERVYLTNAVKRFKWKPMGKMRLHQNPSSSEISACKIWLNAELNLLKPKLLICLGTSAAQSILGKKITLKEVRGRKFETRFCQNTWVTTHPSAILRQQDPLEKEKEFEAFIQDIRNSMNLS